jgi:hypothetical protein
MRDVGSPEKGGKLLAESESFLSSIFAQNPQNHTSKKVMVVEQEIPNEDGGAEKNIGVAVPQEIVSEEREAGYARFPIVVNCMIFV